MRAKDLDRFKSLSRRSLILGGGKLALLSALAGRLYWLQVVESEQYALLAEDNRINLRLLPPRRGRVLDRFGEELANNRRNFRVLLIAEQTDSVERTLERLAQVIELESAQRGRVLREAQRKRKFMPVMVAENLSWEDFARVNLHSPDLPGVQLDIGETRDYPHGATFAHLVGYVSAVSEQDLGEDPVLELPGFRIGKTGVERVYDLNLRGKAGDSRVEVNAFGRVIRELARHEGKPGDDLALTIDADLQRFTAKRLGEESAAVVVMDCHNGDVLAMVSNPGFDPNVFNVGVTTAEWRRLNAHKLKPLLNKAVQGQYPPGSTYKMIVLLAALEAGAIGPDHRVFCPGQVTLGNYTFHCWKKGGHGSVGCVGSLQESCDVFYYDISRRIGPDKIAEMARRFGLGAPSGIDLPNERGGLIPTRDWKYATLGQRWSEGETLVIGIGQGYVLTTPLQLAVMTARLGNGGYAVKPRLVRPPEEPDPAQRAPSLGISAASLNIAIEGMRVVSNHPRGTAYGSRIAIPGQQLAGKTGTSQVRRITQRERELGKKLKPEDKPWEERDHALFVAFAPVGNPRYACAVIVEHGIGGSKAAAPVAKDVLIEAQRLDPAGKRPELRQAAAPPARGEG